MKTILALLSAAGLCAHGAACAQSTTPAAPKAATPALSAGKLPAVPAKPGSGQTAALINGGGSGSVVCTNGPDGVPHCDKTEIDGKSDGGGGGEVIPNLPADNFGNQAPVAPKIIPPSDADEKKKDQLRELCMLDFRNRIESAVGDFNARVQSCSNLQQLKVSLDFTIFKAELDRVGAVIDHMGQAVGLDCVSLAIREKRSTYSTVEKARDLCLAKAEQGKR